MTSKPYPYRILAFFSVLALTSLWACGGQPATDNAAVQYGNDVAISGSNPTLSDSIMGDAMLAGGDLRFSGIVGGDYLGAGGSQVIEGQIQGSVRAAGGNVTLRASVGRNATIAGGDVHLERSAIIGRNAYLAGGTVRVEGRVQEGLQVMGGTVILDGPVGSNVEIVAGALRIGPNTEIGGNLRYRVPKGKVQIDSAARIAGTVTASEPPERRGVWAFLRFLWMLGFLVTGVVLVALMPRFTTESVATLRERPGPSGLAGLGWVILVPIAILILAITVIGLPLALMLTALYAGLLYLGPVVPAVWLGQRILGTRVRPGRWGVVLTFILGAVLLLLVRMIPILGTLVMAVLTVLGLGAILLRIYTLRRRQDTPTQESAAIS